MGVIREYKVSSVHMFRKRVLVVTPAGEPNNIKFKFLLRPYSKTHPTAVWYAGSGDSKNGKEEIDEASDTLVGISKSDYIGKDIEIVIGNPEFNDSKEFKLSYSSGLRDGTYSMPLTTTSTAAKADDAAKEENPNEDGGKAANAALEKKEVNLRWKRTRDVDGFFKKMDQGLHFKLVDTADDRVLARYIHTPSASDLAGTVEIWEEFGIEKWDLFVMISTIAQADQNLRLIVQVAAAS